jgi:hypothetical protein
MSEYVMENQDKLEEIFENTIPHSVFLDKKSIISCMYQSYMLGTEDVLEWLSNMEYLSDNIKYIKEEWYNQQKKN